jgi:glucan 1,3-beta-glucosidase
MTNVNFLWGQMGIANAQRTLNLIRTLVQFISQDQYKDVVPMFGVINEPFSSIIGANPVKAFYSEVYSMIREITGVGEGQGPWIVLREFFFLLPRPVISPAQGFPADGSFGFFGVLFSKTTP